MNLKNTIKKERTTKTIRNLWTTNTIFFLNELADFWECKGLLSTDEEYFMEKARKLTGRKISYK